MFDHMLAQIRCILGAIVDIVGTADHVWSYKIFFLVTFFNKAN